MPAISLVIPAYNEEQRLPPFLQSVRPYMTRAYGDSYEVIVVDDGSRDRSAELVEEASRDWPQLRVIRQPANRGKGCAVRTGILASRGRLVLFSDADGAAPISEEKKLRDAIAGGADVAIGSRLLASRAECSRTWFRTLVSRAFSALVRLCVGLPIRDTQCGFKMFRGSAGRQLVRLCSRDDYLFDVLLLLLAPKLGYSVVEVGIRWHDVAGSRLSFARDSWKMAVGLTALRRKADRVLAEHRRSGPADQAAGEDLTASRGAS